MTVWTPPRSGKGLGSKTSQIERTKGFASCVHCRKAITRKMVSSRTATVVPRDQYPRSASSQAYMPFLTEEVPIPGKKGLLGVFSCLQCVAARKREKVCQRVNPHPQGQTAPPAPAQAPAPATPRPAPARDVHSAPDRRWDEEDVEAGEDSDDAPDVTGDEWTDHCFDPAPESADPSPARRGARGQTAMKELKGHHRGSQRQWADAVKMEFTRPASASKPTGVRVTKTAMSSGPSNGEYERPGVFDPAWFRTVILPTVGCTATMGCSGRMVHVTQARCPSGQIEFSACCSLCDARHGFNSMGKLGGITPCDPFANVQESRDCVSWVLSQGTSQKARAADFARGAEKELVMPAPAWKRFFEVAMPGLRKVHEDTFALVRKLVKDLGGVIVAGDGNWVRVFCSCLAVHRHLYFLFFM